MSESKITLTDRLRREGRWEEASLFRDQKRREFRSTGMSKAEAREAAWEALAEAFPPLSLPAAPTSTAEPQLLSAERLTELYRRKPNRVLEWLKDDVTTVGDSVSKPPEHFHSMGMYGLWRWAHANRDAAEDMEWAVEDSEELLMLHDYGDALAAAEAEADEHESRREFENERLEGSFASAFVARVDNGLDAIQTRYPEFCAPQSWTVSLVAAIAPAVRRHVIAAIAPT
jgi:hypothetical protein